MKRENTSMGNKESTHSKTNGKEKEKNQKTETLQSLKRSKEQKCIICKLKVRDAEGERCWRWEML